MPCDPTTMSGSPSSPRSIFPYIDCPKNLSPGFISFPKILWNNRGMTTETVCDYPGETNKGFEGKTKIIMMMIIFCIIFCVISFHWQLFINLPSLFSVNTLMIQTHQLTKKTVTRGWLLCCPTLPVSQQKGCTWHTPKTAAHCQLPCACAKGDNSPYDKRVFIHHSERETGRLSLW